MDSKEPEPQGGGRRLTPPYERLPERLQMSPVTTDNMGGPHE